MKTVFLLMAQYDAKPVIPIDLVQRDYFPHLDVKKFSAKCEKGEIDLAVIRTDPGSQKTFKGIALQNLADYLDNRREAARKEHGQLRPN